MNIDGEGEDDDDDRVNIYKEENPVYRKSDI